jgi:predicted glycosyltransferase
LYRFLKDRSIDLAVSQSSFHSPVVARLLGARSIYLNANEHALGNVPAFLFADVIMLPEFLDIRKVRWQGARAAKVRHFPGIRKACICGILPINSCRDALIGRRRISAERST